ncbi:hypothetical protein MMC21_001240 [Puttea exsequens]|nr:hypothetical protein [Puttea exsequens]
MASNNAVIEMQPALLEPAALHPEKDVQIPLPDLPSTRTHSRAGSESPRPGTPFAGTGPVVQERQRWNNPRINTWRLFAVFFAFFNFGMNDASYGAVIPYVEADYNLQYLVASLVFLSPFTGYALAAIFSDPLHRLFGRRGIALLNSSCRLIAYVIISAHPPFPAVVAVYALAGLGNGLLDASWNAWIGTMDQQNELLGLMHGCYGVGATISPVIATTMVTKEGWGWWTFYYIMAGVVTVEVGLSTTAFWTETGEKYRDGNRADGEEKGMTKIALKQRVTWICAAFFLTYVGTEVTLGGWIVTFMLRVRHAPPFPSGMTATGFWAGLTLGRLTLGFLTPRIGEKLAVTLYLLLALTLELIFWLVPSFLVSAIAIALVGFFIGPLFPSGVVAATKLLPRELHVAAIGFSAAVGGCGAAVLPFAVGAVVQARGVGTLQPVVLGLLGVQVGIWLCLPRIPKHEHQA